jgi:hypothetical protein
LRSLHIGAVSTHAFRAATASEFIAAVEKIVMRKVQAFASGVDPDANVVFETFYFEPSESGSDGDGVLTTERARLVRTVRSACRLTRSSPRTPSGSSAHSCLSTAELPLERPA